MLVNIVFVLTTFLAAGIPIHLVGGSSRSTRDVKAISDYPYEGAVGLGKHFIAVQKKTVDELMDAVANTGIAYGGLFSNTAYQSLQQIEKAIQIAKVQLKNTLETLRKTLDKAGSMLERGTTGTGNFLSRQLEFLANLLENFARIVSQKARDEQSVKQGESKTN